MSRVFKKKKLIVICGPTASGKTGLAIKLALRLSSGQAKKKFGIKGAEIISADSRQIYRGMDIATAKAPSSAKATKGKQKDRKDAKDYIVKDIPHYLIDIVEPDEEFTVADYQKLANEKISEIQNRGKIPFLVGGTGLYINAVIYGYKIPKGKPDRDLRKRLERQSNEKLLKKLQKLDPETASNIDPNNKRRLIRALEVCIKTGKPFSEQKIKKSAPYDTLILGIDIPREKLYQKIDQRTEKMLNDGLIPETKLLLKKGYSPNSPAMSGIGYKEIVEYLHEIEELKNPCTRAPRSRTSSLQGKKLGTGPCTEKIWCMAGQSKRTLRQFDYAHCKQNSEQAKKQLLDETIDLIKKNTRGYAKRQITWFKKDKNIHWIKNYNQAEKLIKNFLNRS